MGADPHRLELPAGPHGSQNRMGHRLGDGERGIGVKGRESGRLVEPTATELAAMRSTLPRGSAAGKGQVRATVGRGVVFSWPGRATSTKEVYSSRHCGNPGTNDTPASVLRTRTMSRTHAGVIREVAQRPQATDGFRTPSIELRKRR